MLTGEPFQVTEPPASMRTRIGSGGLPGGLPIPPRQRRQGRRLGVDVGSVRVGLAISDPTGTLDRRVRRGECP